MPLDPTIANPVQFKMPDPMEQMGGFLTNALMMEKIQAGREERMNNALLNESYKAAGTDKNKLYQEIINRGQGRNVPALMKQFAEVDDKQASADKGHADATKVALENLSQVLPLVTQQNYASVMSKDPIIGKQLAAQGLDEMKLTDFVSKMAPQQFDQLKQQQMLGVKESLKKNYHLISEESGQKLVAVNEYGDPNAQVAGTYGAKPQAGNTININNGGDDYSKKLAQLRAEDDFKKGKQAEAAPLILGDVRRAMGLVDRAYTGYLAEGQGTLNSIGNAVGFNTNDDARVATQELKMILSGDMLKNIGTLRNEYDVKLGSVTEKEFTVLQNTVPKITDDPATMRAWLTRLEKATIRAQQEYQSRLNDISTNPVTAPAVKGMSVPPPPALPGSGQPPGPPPVPGIQPKSSQAGFQKNVELLRSKKVTPAEFDKKYGPGAAARILGGAPNGGNPFPGEAGAR